jgi:hypothetical protein
MKYYVVPESRDNCAMPTMPDAVPVQHIGTHIEWWLARFQQQGYYSNARQQRIPLGQLSFRLVPEGENPWKT